MTNKVKEFREEANLSQEKLAEMSGVSRNTISSLETKENVNITYLVMKKISMALNKTVQEIFFNE